MVRLPKRKSYTVTQNWLTNYVPSNTYKPLKKEKDEDMLTYSSQETNKDQRSSCDPPPKVDFESQRITFIKTADGKGRESGTKINDSKNSFTNVKQFYFNNRNESETPYIPNKQYSEFKIASRKPSAQTNPSEFKFTSRERQRPFTKVEPRSLEKPSTTIRSTKKFQPNMYDLPHLKEGLIRNQSNSKGPSQASLTLLTPNDRETQLLNF